MSSSEDENRLIAERRQKLTRMRAQGVAFPNTFHRTALADELLHKHGLTAEAIAEQVVGELRTR